MKKDVLLSLCMIVKNEELVLDRCLSSVYSLVDEIIIVDTGSTDKTKEIAQKYTDKIYDFEWCDDFSKARNFSFSKATGKYIMWLDADDVVTKENLEKLQKLKSGLIYGSVDFYMLKYDIAFDECGKPTFSYYRERIVKNTEELKWQGFVHEYLTPTRKIEYEDISIKHNKIKNTDLKRNLKMYEKKIDTSYKFLTRDLYYYSRELYYNGEYEKAIIFFNKTLSQNDLWIEDRIGAIELKARCENFLKQYNNAIDTLLQSFKYDIPRANILCLLGDTFIYRNCHNIAISWYMLAIKCQDDKNILGFKNVDFYDFYPKLQLCVCYFKIGNIEKSYYYHLETKGARPNNKTVLENDKFFNDYLKKSDKNS